MAIPHLVAHRGHMELYPENTLLSIEAALQCGATYVEFDVQSTADGQLVVFHDSQLERTTGVKGNLFELTYEELKNIRAHEPQRFSLAFFNEHIPMLSEVASLLKKYPGSIAFVDIKPESLDTFGMEAVLKTIIEDLRDVRQQCVLISYSDEATHWLREHSDYLCGWILRHYDAASQAKAEKLKPDYLIINHRKLPPNTEPWQGEWQWMVYDVTDPELAMHYSTFNIPLIETRDICRMLEHPLLALNIAQHRS